MKHSIIITFDLEEFDFPLEHHQIISEEEQFRITTEGLQRLVTLLNLYDVRATFFITGNFCEKHPTLVKMLSEKHEIASHAYYHSQFDEEYIIKSKSILESTTGKQVKGFRMPLMQVIDYATLKQAGYEYDSSVNPTFIPGRYNNFGISRKPYNEPQSGIIEFPVSVSPLIRFPLFWLSFKNLPLLTYKLLCNWTLQKDTYLHLYFHPWEFADISSYKIPGYIKRLNGDRYAHKFGKLLQFLKSKGECVTVDEFLKSYFR